MKKKPAYLETGELIIPVRNYWIVRKDPALPVQTVGEIATGLKNVETRIFTEVGAKTYIVLKSSTVNVFAKLGKNAFVDKADADAMRKVVLKRKVESLKRQLKKYSDILKVVR